MIEFRMPSLGADMEAGTLAQWLVKPGDVVKRGDIVATVDTQKGLIDIEVFDAGIISNLLIKENEKVPVGSIMAIIAEGGTAEAKKADRFPQKMIDEIALPAKDTAIKLPRTKISPLAKKIATELGIDWTKIKGTGEDGAITKDDIDKIIIENVVPKEEKTSVAAENIRAAVAAAMSRSNREIPHYYLETKVDMSRALDWLTEENKKRSVKQRLLPVVLIIKAVAKALISVPDLNGYWENKLQRKKDINIGFVVSLRSGGVIIPAIRNADKQTIDELMVTLNDTIPRARALKLRSSELSESTFSLTNLGEGNAETVFGMIYPPQVGLIGCGGITEQPWAESGMLDVRRVMNITLSADHRATDGATGSRFLIAIKNYLQKPDEL